MHVELSESLPYTPFTLIPYVLLHSLHFQPFEKKRMKKKKDIRCLKICWYGCIFTHLAVSSDLFLLKRAQFHFSLVTIT